MRDGKTGREEMEGRNRKSGRLKKKEGRCSLNGEIVLAFWDIYSRVEI